MVCSGCHSVTNIRTQRLSKEEWTSEIDQMVDHGATITDEQIPVILDYLTKNFGADSKVLVNTAPAVEFRAIFGLTANEADAIVAYRDNNGDFHQVSDLQKVPKVEWKKIELKKDLLEF
jgi:competence ComEA-like helix-hairpin-helix protein